MVKIIIEIYNIYMKFCNGWFRFTKYAFYSRPHNIVHWQGFNIQKYTSKSYINLLVVISIVLFYNGRRYYEVWNKCCKRGVFKEAQRSMCAKASINLICLPLLLMKQIFLITIVFNTSTIPYMLNIALKFWILFESVLINLVITLHVRVP